ncbi:glycosyltransferase family 1 protein [Candidatus Microgenomates bacterium]|nr:MAG: glycosyltransferase family 1 protein [Candidatus Microgenomates bacterium]
MKIIFSIYDSLKNPYYGGGGARSTHEIAKRLAKNHWVTILCGSFDDTGSEMIDGVHYRYVGVPFVNPKLGQLIFILLLPFYASVEQFDIWFEHFLPPHSTTFIPLFTKKPVVGITTILHASEFAKKYKLPFQIIEKFGLTKYRHLVVLTESLKQKIKKSSPASTIDLIPLGVERRYLRLKKQVISTPYILYIGRIDIEQKGLDLLLHSWKEYQGKARTPIQLKIAGSGLKEEEKKLKKLIRRLKVKDSVELLGTVAGSQKAKLFSQALFCVFPSRFETFGLALLESMATGTPALIFDIPGFSWVAKSAVTKVKMFDSKSFVREMIRLTENKNLRQMIGSRAKQFAQQFDYDAIAHQYQQLIVRLAT